MCKERTRAPWDRWLGPDDGARARLEGVAIESRLLVRKIRFAVSAVLLVLIVGTAGYVVLGFGLLDAFYQTVTTVTTVGFREVMPLSSVGKLFTIGLIFAGVGTTLYALGVVLESIVEGHLLRHVERRRMTRTIDRMHGHVIVCGWGRVGRAAADHLKAAGHQVVVIDRDPTRLEGIDHPYVVGDVSDDNTLRSAAIDRALALVAALHTDADNVYVTLSARALRSDLIIIARAHSEESNAKLRRAGADRVVNPALIGGRRMAAFALQPDVSDFLEVVMHDESVDFRIEQVEIASDSALCGRPLGAAAVARTGVVVLALRDVGSTDFIPNPPPGVVLAPDTILIVVGTPAALELLRAGAAGAADSQARAAASLHPRDPEESAL